MDASDQGIYNTAVDWYKGRGFWFSPPEVKVQDGKVVVKSTGNKLDWPSHPMMGSVGPSEGEAATSIWTVEYGSLSEVYDVTSRLKSDLADYYRKHIRNSLEMVIKQVDPVTGQKRKFGALVLEPMCLGAGGMVFVDPLFQRVLMDVVRDSEDLFKQGKIQGRIGEKDWRGLPVLFDEGQSKPPGRLNLQLMYDM
jgi:dethiobiotin synthetase/adenosylmethionine--8-amino-7-oxononanoate aminotransferase